jgi:hypothetical protein
VTSGLVFIWRFLVHCFGGLVLGGFLGVFGLDCGGRALLIGCGVFFFVCYVFGVGLFFSGCGNF